MKAAMTPDPRPSLEALLAQVKSNQQHERHATIAETSYWCRQWRLLAEQLAAVASDPRSSLEALARLVEKARAATTELRDAAREGRVIEFRQRDPLVMAIHRALDAALARVEQQAPALQQAFDTLPKAWDAALAAPPAVNYWQKIGDLLNTGGMYDPAFLFGMICAQAEEYERVKAALAARPTPTPGAGEARLHTLDDCCEGCITAQWCMARGSCLAAELPPDVRAGLVPGEKEQP